MAGDFKCTECDKTYKYWKSLKKHKRAEHDPNAKKYKCLNCIREFKLKHHLKSHEKNCSKGTVVCPMCSYMGSHYSLDEHYVSVHDINLELKVFHLKNEVEFFEMKKKIEDEDICCFVTWRSKFFKKDGGVRSIFRCHRDGRPRPYTDRDPKWVKSLGTNKIGAYCPARLDLTVYENKCLVKVCRTHVGHNKEVERLPISKEEQIDLAHKVSLQIPTRNIINEVKKSVINTNKIKRIHLLKRSDVYSAARSFNLKIKPNEGLKFVDDGIENRSQILNDVEKINDSNDNDLKNDWKPLGEKKALLKEKIFTLINETEKDGELRLIDSTFKSLSQTVGALKMDLTAPLPVPPVRRSLRISKQQQ